MNLTGCLLLDTKQCPADVTDPVERLHYNRVLLVCDHNEDGNSWGIVLNKPMPLQAEYPKQSFLKLVCDEDGMESLQRYLTKDQLRQRIDIYLGGSQKSTNDSPDPSSDHWNFFMIYRAPAVAPVKNDIEIGDNIWMTGNHGSIGQALVNVDPKFYRLVTGYDVWNNGALEQEIKDEKWLVLPAHENNAFLWLSPEEHWLKLANKMNYPDAGLSHSFNIAPSPSSSSPAQQQKPSTISGKPQP
ncbi:MAG: YqgE/AlgH family protein [Alphaproteobacteria bacterium]